MVEVTVQTVEPKPQFKPITISITFKTEKELDAFDDLLSHAADGGDTCTTEFSKTFREIAEIICLRIRGQ